MDMISHPIVTVLEYDPTWPIQFHIIANKLQKYLDLWSVTYRLIEHVGSTAIPGLVAKPNIDIVITVPDAENAAKACEVLVHEPSPEEHYKCYGDGGIHGRISMKPHVGNYLADQSVYIIREDDPAGQLLVRCHVALRNTLRLPEHEALKEEHGPIKLQLSKSAIDGVDYGQKKNPVIRKILKVGGWSDAEIDLKEGLDHRIPGERDDPPYQTLKGIQPYTYDSTPNPQSMGKYGASRTNVDCRERLEHLEAGHSENSADMRLIRLWNVCRRSFDALVASVFSDGRDDETIEGMMKIYLHKACN